MEFEKNVGRTWGESNGVQTDYYDFLQENKFISGDAKNKPKDAREKTSGLVALGLIDDNRKLTEVGTELLKLSEENNFSVDNIFELPADSFIYFKQLLKTSLDVEKLTLRPFIITIYLIEKLGGLSFDEFTYILPLCIDRKTTLQAVENIQLLREHKISIDDIIFARLMDRENYKLALEYFLAAETVTEEIISEIGINRKSRSYDRAYFSLYVALHKFYVEKNKNVVHEIFKSLKKLSNTGTLWQKFLFGKNNPAKIKKSPLEYLQSTKFDSADTELKFRREFFATLHIIKAKRSLADYFDLNRRYMKTSDAILFADEKVTLDIIPHYYFAPICENLLNIAFNATPYLQENCSLEKISDFLAPNESVILNGINQEFSLNLKSLQDTSEILERQRYIRLQHLIDSKFTDEQILQILNLIAVREDSEIQKLVTDNADIPTIFEYVLGILWYKVSTCDFLFLSLTCFAFFCIINLKNFCSSDFYAIILAR